MITIRRSHERRHEERRKQVVWLTFFPRDRANPLADGFGCLESLSENRLAPQAAAPPLLHHNVEIITYVREGAVAGDDGVIRAGEFQRITAPQAVRQSYKNASKTHWAHVFQIWLRPSLPGLTPGSEQKRFSLAERSGSLCVIASPDARQSSLTIQQDVLIHSALLSSGRHLIYELLPGRSAWLHLVQGEVVLEGAVLTTGDSAGIEATRAVSLTAREKSEILLFDLGPLPTHVEQARRETCRGVRRGFQLIPRRYPSRSSGLVASI